MDAPTTPSRPPRPPQNDGRQGTRGVPPGPARRATWWALLAGTGLVALAGGGVAAAVASLHTASGTAWWLARVPGLSVSGAQGALLGDFSAAQISLQLSDQGPMVVIDDLASRGLQVGLSPDRGAWLAVAGQALTIGRVTVTPGAATPPTAPTPRQAPRHLRLPVTVQWPLIEVGTLHHPALGERPLRGLSASVTVGGQAGAQHRIDLQRLDWDRFRLSGHAQLTTGGDLATDLRLDLSEPGPSEASGRWPQVQARLNATGPLSQLALVVDASAQPAAASPSRASKKGARPTSGAADPTTRLHLQAGLRPFDAWPVAALQARWQALDLSAFSAAAPRTQLTGTASIDTPGPSQPAALRATLNNARAGRWNDGLLPLRQLQVALKAPLDQPQFATLTQFDAELGSTQASAGRWRATGQHRADGWALNTTLDAVQPAALDARAPAMRLSGPLTLRGPNTHAVSLSTDLRGELATGPGAPTERRAAPVHIQLEANARTGEDGGVHAQVAQAVLHAGLAQARLSGLLQRTSERTPWQAQAQAELQAFDPLVWWPGALPAARRTGTTLLNASASIDLSIAPATTTDTASPERQADWQAHIARLAGQAQLALRDSRLADLPVNGTLALRASTRQPASAEVQLQLAGNRLQASAHLTPAQGTIAYRGDASVDAPALQRLQPLMAWLPRANTPPPANASNNAPTHAAAIPPPLRVSGAVQGQAQWQGEGAVLNTQGQFTLRGVALGPAQLQQGDLSWRLGTTLDAPLQLQARLAQLTLPGPSLDRLQLTLEGNARAHTLSLQSEVRQARADAPPANLSAARRVSAVLQLQGGLGQATAQDTGALPTAWRGTVQQLTLSDASPPNTPWVTTRDLGVALQWGAHAHSVALQPGQLDLRLGSTRSALRWTQAQWQHSPAADGGPGTTRYQVQATLDPLAVSPLLAALQPDFGWGGDLVVGGRVAMQSDPRPVADVVLERLSGDLQISDENDTQTLGLTDLRLALSAANGVWNFTQAVAGEALGVVVGAFVARTPPGQALPDATTPLQGVLELQVKNLASLATWVPPGWRLGGALQSSASLAGTLGAPEFTGQLKGQQVAVRNVLQGVNVTDGDVAISLRGETARIERFSARAGNGTLSLTGDASLGAAPSANLQLVAEKFQVLGRVDQRVVASGQAQLKLAANRVALDGGFTVDEGLFDFSRSDAPSLASDVVVKRASPTPGSLGTTPKPVARGAPGGTQRVLALNLGIGLGEQLRLKGRGLSTRLRGDLKLTSPGGKLALTGAVRTEGGNYDAYGQKLMIDRGVVTFVGPIDNPRLDIEATRPKTDIRVGVTVGGTAQSPRVRLFSEPDLPDVDKLSWLVLGRASSGLGRTDTALLQRAAVALFAGEEEGVVTKLTRSIGLDEISLRQTDGEVRETIVTLGKQLSERLYVGYERGLNSTAGNFQLLYRIAQRFTLRGQTGLDNAVDFIFTWRWQ